MRPISKYLKYWPLFLICMFAALATAAIIIHFRTPDYLISTTLLLQDDKKGEGVLKESAFSDLNMFHTTKTIDNEIQVLRSVNLINKVLQRLSVTTRSFIYDGLRKKEVFGQDCPIKATVHSVSAEAYASSMRIKGVDSQHFSLSLNEGNAKTYRYGSRVLGPGFSLSIERGRRPLTPGAKLDLSLINTLALAKSYHNIRLEIIPVVKEANVLQLSLYDNIPARGAAILDQLVREYNSEDVARKNRMALATIRFIDTRLSYLSGDLGSVELNLQRYKQQNRVTNVQSDAQSNLARAESYKQELEGVKVQLGILGSIDRALRNSAGLEAIVQATAGLQDGTLPLLILNYNNAFYRYRQLLEENSPSNPLVIADRSNLLALRGNIEKNVSSLRANLFISQSNLLRNTAKFEERIRTSPELEQGLQQRDREQGVKANLFEYLIQKREETSLALSANVDDAKVIDHASFDSVPARPKRQFIYLYAFVLGLIVPFGVVSAKDMLNSTVDSMEEVTVNANLKILGELCHTRENGILAIDGRYRNNITELFRYIRTNLTSGGFAEDQKVLLVTSSIQGEGKTFTSINLAATLANIGKRVVLLEFDLRKPDLLRKMSLKGGLGISDYMHSAELSVEDILMDSGIAENLMVIGSGIRPLDAGNELLNPRIAELFASLREEFDYLIVDSSPVALVADAFSLDAHCDATIYVVRYNYTHRSYLNILSDIERNGKLKNLMIVLNDGKIDHLNDYGYGSRFYA